jgi:hypothetical protein
MPVITDRSSVPDIFAEAHHKAWVITVFGVENLNTVEARLSPFWMYRAYCSSMP